ncbi:MAG TPA: WYL domain-containing protein [Flavobacteriales bacterium]
MPANKYALLRYRIIDRCLTNKAKPYPTREDLRQACEDALYGSGGEAISLSTIDKDIYAMKYENELGYLAPIAFSRQHGGYYYEDPDYTIAELSLGEEDLQAIRFATATLEQFKDVPIFKQYESAIEKIINRVNISPNPADSALDNFIQFEKSTVSKGNEYLGPLLEYIRSRKSIRVVYRKFTDDKTKEYELHPYLLKEYHNRWYLIAKEQQSGKIRTFGLERIESLELGEKKFTMDKNFNPDTFFKYSIGITERAEKPEQIVLSFEPVAGKFLKTQPIHPSQKVLKETAKEIQIGLNVLITQELINLILSYGPNVQVLKPMKLKNEIVALLKQTLSSYSK